MAKLNVPHRRVCARARQRNFRAAGIPEASA